MRGGAFRRLVLTLAALLAASAPAHARQSLEYPVKAAFLYKFGGFVTWPQGAFRDGASPLVVCVVGRDPFGAALERTVRGERIGARPVSVRRLTAVGPDSGCHVVYAGGPEVADTLRAVRGAPVLTVTDEARGEARGVVHFVVRDNRVRFHIDDSAAGRQGLEVSSKLLNLALTVRPRG